MEDPVYQPVGPDNPAAPNTRADDDEANPVLDEAAAAAEVALMDGHFNNRTGRGNNANRAADEAILGAAATDVEAYLAQDESGNLVEQRFLQFLEAL